MTTNACVVGKHRQAGTVGFHYKYAKTKHAHVATAVPQKDLIVHTLHEFMTIKSATRLCFSNLAFLFAFLVPGLFYGTVLGAVRLLFFL